MKTIIAGSRGVTDYNIVLEAIKQSGFEITEVVSGTARGVDKLGERYAVENVIPITRFVPDWNKYGKRAGFLRNAEMGDYAEALVAVWDGESRGTKQMIDYATKKGLKVFVYET